MSTPVRFNIQCDENTYSFKVYSFLADAWADNRLEKRNFQKLQRICEDFEGCLHKGIVSISRDAVGVDFTRLISCAKRGCSER
jgi:hypothetical protein